MVYSQNNHQFVAEWACLSMIQRKWKGYLQKWPRQWVSKLVTRL